MCVCVINSSSVTVHLPVYFAHPHLLPLNRFLEVELLALRECSHVVFFFLAAPRSRWDLSSLTRIQTCAAYSGSTES